jgi:hypothetical protein
VKRLLCRKHSGHSALYVLPSRPHLTQNIYIFASWAWGTPAILSMHSSLM